MMKRVLLVIALVGIGVLAIVFLARNAIVSAIARSQAEAHGVHCERLALSLSSLSEVEVAPTRCTFDAKPGVILDLPEGAWGGHRAGRLKVVAVPRMRLTLEPTIEDFSHVAEALFASQRGLPSSMRAPVAALAQLSDLSGLPYFLVDQIDLQRGSTPLLHLSGVTLNRPRAGVLTVEEIEPAGADRSRVGARIEALVVYAQRDEVAITGSLTLHGPLVGPFAVLDSYGRQTFRITGRDLRTAPTYTLDVERPPRWQAIEPLLLRALSAH